MKRYHYILAAFALIFIMFGSIKSAMSYFSTYAEARGQVAVNLGEKTSIDEWYDGNKHIRIKNNEDNVAVYVRAKAFISEEYKDSLDYILGEYWRDSQGDEDPTYKYYKEILKPGETTQGDLEIKFSMPEDPELNDNFNVVVVYESVPVIYDDNGNPVEDWNQKIITKGGN